MNSSTRDIITTLAPLSGLSVSWFAVISLLPKGEDPKIATNANNIPVDNRAKERSDPSNQNQLPAGRQPERLTNGRDTNERIVDTHKAEEPKERTINNDIGVSRKNGLFEITLENAWASSTAVHLPGCSIDIPANQKAVLVRFTRRLWSSRQLSWDEQSNLLSIKPTDFLLIDDAARRMEPSCTASPFYAVSESSQTFVYLMPRNSNRLIFRFQHPGLGEPISFDLSGLD